MKRNLYGMLMMLFILSACRPISGAQVQIATATEMLISSTPYSPAIFPEISGEFSISLDDYPINPLDFTVDSRSNEEKMNLIISWAPDDVEKETALFDAEFRRMGIGLSDIKYEVSIVDGKSWALYPKNIKTGKSYIVSIGGIIRPSIDLFGYLDKDINDDFFDLKEVNISNATVIGDKSGWHVFAEVKDGKVTQWLNATTDQIKTVQVEPEPSPTPENQFRIVGVDDVRKLIKEDQFPTELPRVTLEDITSGKLLDMERKWLEEHPFSPDAVPMDLIKEKYKNTVLAYPKATSEYTNFYQINFRRTDPNIDYQKNPEKRPFKIIGFYNLWDEKLYQESGFFDDLLTQCGEKGKIYFQEAIDRKGTFFSVVSWAYLNPDREVFIGHFISPVEQISFYFDHIFNRTAIVNGERVIYDWDTKITPIYDIDDKDFFDNMLTFNSLAYYIWKNYPETSPKPFVNQIVSQDAFPKELETKLFTFRLSVNDPWGL